MDRQKLEPLLDALTHFSGFLEPGSPLNRARNPLGLRPLKPEQPRDEHGFRVFRSVLDGMQAALFDLEIKVCGRLAPESTLTDLACSYGHKATVAQAWARHLRKALADETITHHTAIKRFIEDTNGR